MRIPSRKRRRIVFDEPEEGNDDDVENARQLVFRSTSENMHYSGTESEGEQRDENNAGPGQEADELIAEDAGIQSNLTDLPGHDMQSSPQEKTASLNPRRRRSRRIAGSARGLGLQGPELLELTDENGRPYPGSYNNPLLELYSQDDPQISETHLGKRKRQKKKPSFASDTSSAAVDRRPSGAGGPIDRRESSTSLKSVRFEDERLTTPPTTILDAQENEDTEDEDFEAPNYTDGEMDESDKENAEPKFDQDVSSEVSLLRVRLGSVPASAKHSQVHM